MGLFIILCGNHGYSHKHDKSEYDISICNPSTFFYVCLVWHKADLRRNLLWKHWNMKYVRAGGWPSRKCIPDHDQLAVIRLTKEAYK